MPCFVSVPLNANELLAQGAELQQLMFFYLTQTCTEHFKNFYIFK